MRTSLSRLTAPLAALPLILLSAGCLGTDVAGPVDPQDLTFATSLGVDLDAMTITASGLYWQDELAGEGNPAEYGNVLTLDYSLWLHDGRLVESTTSGDGVPLLVDGIAGNPPETGGWNQLIPGMREGLIGMRIGGRRLLVIPSHLAYGPYGAGPIPRYATVVFRIELLTNSSAD
ncbi:MAG: FKBP-type peptidyl-prolyl cis-trans isomerase [Gemmatimonadota bacterium]